jgi:hypothetical protein
MFEEEEEQTLGFEAGTMPSAGQLGQASGS